ncbi:type II secretion system F family protein [Algihabitans albus]|uniref:type II secretion system F family protein n=1 Tax=Algihabitans albus TaxID=2164067 RepID=UPI000E5D6D52|nr:type II secretion system F family protein [Algihabitans albus]
MSVSPDQMIWLLGAGALFTILLLGLGLASDDLAGGRAAKRRLARVSPGTVRTAAASVSSLRRSNHDSSNPLIDRLIKSLLPAPDKLRARLQRTGRDIAISQYLVASLLVALAVGLAAYFALRLPPWVAAAQGVSSGAILPHLVVGFLAQRRLTRFVELFPDAIDLIVRGLRSGLPVTESITTVGQEMRDPVGIEFRRISDAVRVGANLEEAMWSVARRIDVPEFKYLIITLSIQRETGGNLAETLSNLSDLLRKRRQMKLKVRSMSSEARASAWIIGSLPFIMFGLLFMLNGSYMITLIEDPRGNLLLGVALGFVATGAGVMWKMVRFEI